MTQSPSPHWNIPGRQGPARKRAESWICYARNLKVPSGLCIAWTHKHKQEKNVFRFGGADVVLTLFAAILVLPVWTVPGAVAEKLFGKAATPHGAAVLRRVAFCRG